MNKTALKNFAVWARNKLIKDIEYKAGLMGITEKGIATALPQSNQEVQFFDIGTKDYASVRGEEIRQRDSLAQAIRIKEREVGFAAAFHFIVEKVAYTWFNRLVAIRFMEVNDYLPSRVRVLSSENENKAEPDMVTKPFDTDMEFSPADQDYIMRLKDENQLDVLFRWLFIKQCYKLHEALPLLFDSDKIADGRKNEYMELLLTISFTDKDGVLWHLVHDIKEKDFRIRTPEDDERQRIENIPDEDMPAGQVEIIGWLYQYYNTEPKDQVFADLKKNIKISKDKIPAATQLFTPDWIVRYMVENSLGRLWVEGHPNEELKKNWKYYLEEAEQEPEVQAQLAEIRKSYVALRPEDIKVMDPCMGSGHILVYLFDVLMQIYETQGWTQREAAQSIVQNNLYGLDIDERAAQLAYFAVMMKARYYDRRFLERDIVPHVYDIRETSDMNPDYLSLFGDLQAQAQTLSDEMRDAKTYGSILKLSLSEQEIAQLRQRLEEIKDTYYDNFFDSARQNGLVYEFGPILEVAETLVRKYDAVVTNPPYMGSSGMGAKLSQYVKDNYPDSKSDLFAVFIERCQKMTKHNGYQAMITQHSWMSLAAYEKLRSKIYKTSIVNMAHLGARAFDDVSGEMVQTTSFVFQNAQNTGLKGVYCRLVSATSEKEKEKSFLSGKNRYLASQEDYANIPGKPVSAYVASKSLSRIYSQGRTIDKIGEVRIGMGTGNNDLFLKNWWEVVYSKIGLNICDITRVSSSKKKYFPYSKGGERKRWYGNHDFVVWYDDEGQNQMKFTPGHRENGGYDFYFHKGMTWSYSTMAAFCARIMPTGFVFDVNGSSLFMPEEYYQYTIAFLQSCVGRFIIDSIKSAFSVQAGTIRTLPIVGEPSEEINDITDAAILSSKNDWDSFETSWDFQVHPLVRWHRKILDYASRGALPAEDAYSLQKCFRQWDTECDLRFARLKSNEEELNRIFIDIYGLQDELTPEVEDKDVTMHRADLARDIKSLISYAVGCMFGRYSLNRPGLVYAGGDFDKVYWKYKGQAAMEIDENGEPFFDGYAGISLAEYHYPRFKDSENWEKATMLDIEPDADNCIPITDEPYFEDDIVGRFVEFIRVVYGDATLEDNLAFIAKALGNKGNSSREVIRHYFLNDFFKDHCATYSVTGSGKRPIYWLFDSGKQNGFKALVYMHRWNADTVGNLRVEYLHRMQRVYEKEIERMQDTIENGSNSREISQATKRREKLVKQLKEARDYDAKIAHVALSRVTIDLDDGVKVNYEKVQKGPDGKSLGILAKI